MFPTFAISQSGSEYLLSLLVYWIILIGKAFIAETVYVKYEHLGYIPENLRQLSAAASYVNIFNMLSNTKEREMNFLLISAVAMIAALILSA